MNICPVCNNESLISKVSSKNKYKVKCPRCRNFDITGQAIMVLNKNDTTIENSWKISYWIRNNQIDDEYILVTTDDLERIINNTKLPGHLEQADNMLRWLGKEQKTPEEKIYIRTNIMPAVVGCKDKTGVIYVLENLERDGFITKYDETDGRKYRLTHKGWDKYEEIKERGSFVGKVFMAMQYNDKELDSVYNHFKEAVSETGFKLFRLDEYPQAGLLDTNLREQIKQSRFILADLTYSNNGVYWEAGYGEGLVKPVIYLCEKEYFYQHKTHFDTNHLLTIVWDKNDIEKAKEELKTTIRTTFPTEAKISD